MVKPAAPIAECREKIVTLALKIRDCKGDMDPLIRQLDKAVDAYRKAVKDSE